MEYLSRLTSDFSRSPAPTAPTYDFFNRQYERLEPHVSHRKQTAGLLSNRHKIAFFISEFHSLSLRLSHFSYLASYASRSALGASSQPLTYAAATDTSFTPLTYPSVSAIFTNMARANTKNSRRSRHAASAGRKAQKPLKHKALAKHHMVSLLQESTDPATVQQLKAYEEGLKFFQQQKFARAKQSLERVTDGPSKELADRARMHLRICDQRIAGGQELSLKSAEDHYNQGIAMMNLGRWDDAREHLDRALKAAPKADHIVYAMAALDCLTGEAESSMQNLKIAIQLRPENRFRARNDEDFSFLHEDPRFTELLYPEREISNG
jgi:tetratricopeptide (TPR) repeat protein